MDKTIGTKLPEEEADILEKIASERGESVAGFVRNLVRMAIEKNGKVDGSGEEMRPVPDTKLEEILTLLWRLVESKPVQNPDKNPSPETAKKIDEFGKLLSGFPPILDTKIQNVLNEIGKIPKSNGGQVGVGIDPGTITKMAEDIAKNTKKLDALEPTKTGFWIDQLGIKWLTLGGTFAGLVVTVGIIGAYIYGSQNGPIFGAMAKDYRSLVACVSPGWTKQKVTIKGENYLMCSPGLDPKTGKLYGWRIKDLGGVSPSEVEGGDR